MVNQIEPTTGRFDEHKILIGYRDRGQAERAYRENYTRDWQGMGGIVRLTAPPVPRLAERRRDHQAAAAAEAIGERAGALPRLPARGPQRRPGRHGPLRSGARPQAARRGVGSELIGGTRSGTDSSGARAGAAAARGGSGGGDEDEMSARPGGSAGDAENITELTPVAPEWATATKLPGCHEGPAGGSLFIALNTKCTKR
ncbi:hypothetical protein ACRC7T_19030 [Segnochrobactraceae bacterium EtOH-i3]